VKADGSLKVKSVITSDETSPNSKEKIKGNGQASFCLVTILEVNNLEGDTELAEVLEISENAEDFQHGPSNGKSLECHFP